MIEHKEYTENMMPPILESPSTAYAYNWLKWLLWIFTIIVPAAIFIAVRSDLKVICLLACANCLLIGWSTRHFLRRGTLPAMIPVLFVGYLLMGWPVATLYFAFFYPESAFYITIRDEPISYFEGGVRLQCCVSLFLAGYYFILFYLLRNEKTKPTDTEMSNPGAFIFVTTAAGLLIILFNAMVQAGGISGFAAYLGHGLFNYFWGILFIAGAMIKRIPVIFRFIIIAFLCAAIFFYTLGNARGMAVFTVAMFIFGILFISDLSRKIKVFLIAGLIVGFPTFILISNTTRALTGRQGFEDLGYSLKILKEWRYVAERRPATAMFLGRMFSTGGHSIITRTPSEVPYRKFLPHIFIREAAESLLPQRLYHHPYYRGTMVLLDYDFMITEQTSVEVSLIGNLWMMGGYIPVFLGGVMVGLLHGGLGRLIRKSLPYSKMKAYIYFALFAPGILWAFNLDFISHGRAMVYRLILAFIVYQIFRLIIGDPDRNQQLAIRYTEDYQQAAPA
jgi:hypothetical protein